MAEAFPISGNIDPKSFPFLLMDLHHQGATGSLKVEGPAYPKALYYRSGRILFGSSNDPKDQLGSILIENGKIAPEQLAEVNTKVGPGNPLAKVLSESGYVNQRELGEAARVKVERILSDILGYASGTFEFEDGVLPKGAVDLKLSTEKLVVDSVRRVGDRAFVLRHLDSLGVVLSPRAEAAGPLADLQDETGGLSTQIDGRRSVKDAAAAARIDEFEASKIACALLFLGLVERGTAIASPEAVEVNPELDLAQTAAMAFGGEDSAAAARQDDDPFFVSPDDAGPSGLPFPLPEPPAPVALVTPSEPADPFGAAPALDVEAPADNVSFTIPGAPAFTVPEPVEAAPVASEEPTGFAIGPELETTALPVMEPPREPALDFVAPPAPAPAIPAFEAGAFPVQPFEAEPEPAPTRSKPSKEDLAALDALLNPAKAPRKVEAPAMPAMPAAPSRSGRWEPQFQSTAKPRRPAPRQPSPLLLVAAGVFAVAAIGGGSWYYLNAAQPKPTPTPVAPVATPPPVAVAAADTPPPVVASPEGAATAPSPDPAAAAGGAATGSAIGAPSPDPMLAATPAPAPPSVAPPPSTPAPTPRPAGTGAPSPLDNGPATNARSLMRGGSLGAAARGFAQNVNAATGSPYTIQLLVACSTETVQKALDSVSDDDLYILPVNYKGKDCHRVCWGLYGSESSAGSAAGRLPGYFRQNGASPKVVRTATLLR